MKRTSWVVCAWTTAWLTAACGGSSSETPFPQAPIERNLEQRHEAVFASERGANDAVNPNEAAPAGATSSVSRQAPAGGAASTPTRAPTEGPAAVGPAGEGPAAVGPAGEGPAAVESPMAGTR